MRGCSALSSPPSFHRSSLLSLILSLRANARTPAPTESTGAGTRPARWTGGCQNLPKCFCFFLYLSLAFSIALSLFRCLGLSRLSLRFTLSRFLFCSALCRSISLSLLLTLSLSFSFALSLPLSVPLPCLSVINNDCGCSVEM